MAIRHVVTEGDPILRKKCREVKEVTPHIIELMEDMLETMRHDMGVGIAGPQVGVMRRLFVAEPEPERVYFMINPVILESEGEVEDQEGCLSVPNMIGTVVRPERIRMKALDLEGNPQEYEFEGFDARVMCHEYDHLEGILYIDKATDLHDPAEDQVEEDQVDEDPAAAEEEGEEA